MSYSDSGNSWESFKFAKYWCDYSKIVVQGVKRRAEPIDLKDICGTYSWFYEIPSPSYGDPYEIFYDERNRFPGAPGHMTISSPAGEPATLANISGHIEHFGEIAKFKGLQPSKLVNYLLIEKLEWQTDAEKKEENNNALCILDACDDDDNPFVVFAYNTGWSGCMQHFLDIIGKKQKEGSSEPACLTSTEMARLGMGLLASDIKADAPKEGEEEDEEHNDGEEGKKEGMAEWADEQKHVEHDTQMQTEEQKNVEVDEGKAVASSGANGSGSVQSSSQTRANKRKNRPLAGNSPTRKIKSHKA